MVNFVPEIPSVEEDQPEEDFNPDPTPEASQEEPVSEFPDFIPPTTPTPVPTGGAAQTQPQAQVKPPVKTFKLDKPVAVDMTSLPEDPAIQTNAEFAGKTWGEISSSVEGRDFLGRLCSNPHTTRETRIVISSILRDFVDTKKRAS